MTDILNQVRRLQDSLTRGAGSAFSEDELEHLRVIARLSVEFRHYLLRLNESPPVAPIQMSLTYALGSIVSGIDSFDRVSHAYSVIEGSTESDLRWNDLSENVLTQQFLTLFDQFEREQRFEVRCRQLLDLFKLQIVYAGIMYP